MSVLNVQKELFKCEQLIVTNYIIMEDQLCMPPHKIPQVIRCTTFIKAFLWL